MLNTVKELLQKRLAARGLTLTSILLSLMLSPSSEATAIPPELAANTLRNLPLFVRGQEVVAATSSAANPVASKRAGLMIRGMLIAEIRGRALGVVLSMVLAGGGLGAWQVFAHRTDPENPGVVALPTDKAPVAPVGSGKVAQPEAPAQTDGPTALVRGKVLDADGKPVPSAVVTALVRRPFRLGEHGLRDEVVARGQANEQAYFRLRVPADFSTWFPERQVVLVAKAPGHAPLTSIVRLAEQGDINPAPPGVYRVVLMVDGQEQMQGLRLENDPLLKTPNLMAEKENEDEEDQ